MQMKTGNQNTRSAGLPTSMPTVEPKTIIAVVLVGMMLVLWGRVLMRSKIGPAAANADTLTGPVEAGQAKSSVKIRTVALPVLEGRNDRIAADVFNAGARLQTLNRNANQSQPKTGDKNLSAARRVEDLTKAVVLEAVIVNSQGRPEKASINGVVVSEGSSITVAADKEQVVLKVTKIESKQVELTWGEYRIISKMPDYELGL